MIGCGRCQRIVMRCERVALQSVAERFCGDVSNRQRFEIKRRRVGDDRA